MSTTRGGRAHRRESLGHLEAVHAGQLHVEQDDIRAEPLDGVERRLAVLDVADDLEALELEERTRRRAEVLVVVDDQHRRAHRSNRPTDRRRPHRGWHGSENE